MDKAVCISPGSTGEVSHQRRPMFSVDDGAGGKGVLLSNSSMLRPLRYQLQNQKSRDSYVSM